MSADLYSPHPLAYFLADEAGLGKTIEAGLSQALLVCWGTLRMCADAKAVRSQNLTVEKTPKRVLQRCEWDHDDLGLNVANLPMSPPQAKKSALLRVPQEGLYKAGEPASADEGGKT